MGRGLIKTQPQTERKKKKNKLQQQQKLENFWYVYMFLSAGRVVLGNYLQGLEKMCSLCPLKERAGRFTSALHVTVLSGGL